MSPSQHIAWGWTKAGCLLNTCWFILIKKQKKLHDQAQRYTFSNRWPAITCLTIIFLWENYGCLIFLTTISKRMHYIFSSICIFLGCKFYKYDLSPFNTCPNSLFPFHGRSCSREDTSKEATVCSYSRTYCKLSVQIWPSKALCSFGNH